MTGVGDTMMTEQSFLRWAHDELLPALRSL